MHKINININKIKRVILTCSVVGVSMFTLSGCAELKSSMKNLDYEVELLCKQNDDINDELFKVGLLTEENHTNIHNSIKASQDNIQAAFKIEDGDKDINFNVTSSTTTDDEGTVIDGKDSSKYNVFKAISWISPVMSGERLKVAGLDGIQHQTDDVPDLNLSSSARDCGYYFAVNNIVGKAINSDGSTSGNITADSRVVTYNNDLCARIKEAYGEKGNGDRYTTVDGALWFNILRDSDVTQKEKSPNIVNIVPYRYVDTINNILSAPVYVLKANAFDSSDGTKSLDHISESIKSIIDSSATDAEKSDKLHAYFEKATETYVDESGSVQTRALTLLDTSLDGSLGLGAHNSDNIVQVSTAWTPEETASLTDYADNVLGKDWVLNEYGVPVMSLKYRGYNQAAFDKLKSIIGMNESKYKVYKDGVYNGVYLLEYNVSTIDKLTLDGTNVVADIKDPYDSNYDSSEKYLSLNVYTQRIYKNSKSTDGTISSTEIINDNGDGYLILAGSSDDNANTRSSFIASGSTFMSVGGFDSTSGKVESKLAIVPRIILRDYLELNYAPSYITGEPFVAFGRKLRFNIRSENTTTINIDLEVDTDITYSIKSTKIQWSINSNKSMANYIDKAGDVIADSSSIYYTDFCDVAKFYDGYKDDKIEIPKNSIVRLAGSGETIADGDAYSKVNDGATNGDEISELPTYVTTSISVGQLFPGKYIDKSDNNTAEKNQLFYAMPMSTDIFDKGLFDSWINVSINDAGKSEASLEWWITWLNKNNYNYPLDHNGISEYLKKNYSYKLSKATGLIIINPETITKIQNDYEEQDRINMNKKISSIFYIFGFMLLVYSLALLVCWVFDTNIDLGINLLTKMTFGKWVAVKYDTDLDGVQLSKTQVYLTFTKLLKRCLVIDVIAMLIIAINAFTLAYWLVSMFGKIGEELERIFTGLN